MRYAVIDVETTGFSPANDRIVEAACVLIQDCEIVRTWSTLVNPQRTIPPHATRVHGITDRDVFEAPAFEIVQRELRAMCAGATVAAHNAAFDLSFLPALASESQEPNVARVSASRRRYSVCRFARAPRAW